MALFNRHRSDCLRLLRLVGVAPIPLVATYSYVNPLVAILLGYFLGKEILTARILFAASLIIGSVVLVSSRKR